MWQMRYQKVSTWDIAYAVDMAIACLITYWVVAFFLPNLAGRPSTSVGILWAVISTVFVYKDTRSHSLSVGISRLIATMISLILCLSYLLLFPITSFGMAALIFIGTLVTISLGRRARRPKGRGHEVGLTRKLKPYFSKIDFAVRERRNDRYCTASDLAFAVNATG